MAHKMKGMEFGSPATMKTKHGTNANYGKSGARDKNGATFNWMDPLGIAKKAKGLFGKNKGCPPAAAAAKPPINTNAPPGAQPVDPDTQAGPVAGAPPAAAPVEEPVVDPNAGVSAAGAPPVA